MRLDSPIQRAAQLSDSEAALGLLLPEESLGLFSGCWDCYCCSAGSTKHLGERHERRYREAARPCCSQPLLPSAARLSCWQELKDLPGLPETPSPFSPQLALA